MEARTTVTVLFADVAGMTRILASEGDEAGRALLEPVIERMRETATSLGGRVLQRKGDEILVAFDDPSTAAAAACDLQRAVREPPRPGAVPLRLRIGFEHGEVGFGDEGAHGVTVHLAHRLTDVAKAGQILTTASTLALLGEGWRVSSRVFDRRVLKGLPGEHELIEILWDEKTTTVVRSRERAAEPACSALVDHGLGRA